MRSHDDSTAERDGTLGGPDATIAGEPGPLSAVLWHGHSLGAALQSGAIALEGDRAAAERFLALFPAPEPTVPAAADDAPPVVAGR